MEEVGNKAVSEEQIEKLLKGLAEILFDIHMENKSKKLTNKNDSRKQQ